MIDYDDWERFKEIRAYAIVDVDLLIERNNGLSTLTRANRPFMIQDAITLSYPEVMEWAEIKEDIGEAPWTED
jgi:hypothetical protein